MQWIVFLFSSGITINSMEAIQMSGFLFFFAGMVISSVQVEDEQSNADRIRI